ncbi:hypothetical protein DL93DRAFT_2077683 [Clavulina sp. PMI_390]|nr:hypothetical protein DL93DRAFT_2077683 [Clavulina sp. PMI_390]
MECADNRTPSFRTTNEVETLPREAGNRLKLSGRYAELHHPSGQLRSLVWDSKSGQTTSYPLEPHTATSFHTVVVTSGGTVFQVRGDVHEDRLITRFFRLPTGLTRATDYPAKIEIPSKGRGLPWLANSCTYAVTPHHIMRLIEGKTVTPMQVECTTIHHDFSAGVAVSENGELYMLPLVDEPWRLNEHTVPMWMTHPALHFVLTEKPESSRAVSITADHKELFLFAAPHSLYNGGKESGRGLFRVPTFSTDIGARTDRWACIGVCPRSGTWIFTRRAQDRWLATVIRSE